jgi:hypothetical protein
MKKTENTTVLKPDFVADLTKTDCTSTSFKPPIDQIVIDALGLKEKGKTENTDV